jgi:ribonuclease HI
LYCDVSCLGNPGPGGWAYRVWQDRRVLRERSGTEQNTTNNRMELRAAIEGLKSFASQQRDRADFGQPVSDLRDDRVAPALESAQLAIQ